MILFSKSNCRATGNDDDENDQEWENDVTEGEGEESQENVEDAVDEGMVRESQENAGDDVTDGTVTEGKCIAGPSRGSANNGNDMLIGLGPRHGCC